MPHRQFSLYSEFLSCHLITFIALLLVWQGFGGCVFWLGFYFGGRENPKTSKHTKSYVSFKQYHNSYKRCCTGLLTLPFSLTFHHRILGLNMTTDNVLLASIQTLEQMCCTNMGFSSVPILKAILHKSEMHLV